MLKGKTALVLCVWSVGVSGCTYRLLAPNPPFKQQLRLILPDAGTYSVSIEGDLRGGPYPVAKDGRVTLDVPLLSRGCDVYLLDTIKLRSAQNPFERKGVLVTKGTQTIRRMSLSEIARLQLDNEGYPLLPIGVKPEASKPAAAASR